MDDGKVERVARAMHDHAIRQRAEREYAQTPHLIDGYSSPAVCETAWAADGKTRGWWMDKARVAIRAMRP